MAPTPIFGPFYVSRSTNLAANRLVNLYPELVETKQGKAVGGLYLCPGLDLFLNVGTGPIRGQHVASDQNGNAWLFVVSGSSLYQITTALGVTNLGTIGPGQVTMIDNQFQLAVFAGPAGYVFPFTGSLAPIVLPFVPNGQPITAAQQDGFGMINQPNSALWFQSNLLDLTTWDALNFADAAGEPDDVVVIADKLREVWLVKQYDTEIWYNAGTNNFAFARLDGAYMEGGIAASGSLCKVGETFIWLSQNRQGPGEFVQTNGHQLTRISTHAIEAEIQSYSTLSDATAFAYQQGGHTFYVCNFPTADKTWVYDVTDSVMSGIPMWHERASFSGGLLHRHIAETHSLFNGKAIVGDYQNGNLYSFNLSTLLDNGAQRKWLRSWRALPQPSEEPVRFNALRIDMQAGIAIPDGTNPQAVLRWSDDGAHTWSNEKFMAVGKNGATAQRVKFNRLGATRRNSGLDRIFELSSTDPFPVAIVGADLS